MNFLGSWNEIAKREVASAYSFPLIDDSASLGADETAHFKRRYKSDWNELGVDYTHRVFERGPFTVVARGGLAGGWMDQEFNASIVSDSFKVDSVTERVEDAYFGPRLGAELQYRFWENFYAGAGVSVGGVFGWADMGAWQHAETALGDQDIALHDSLNYTGARVGTMIGVGWAPRRWIALEVGYRFEYWTDSPYIENPEVTGLGLAPGRSTGPAHLDTESLMFHGVTGTVSAKFW